MIDFGYLLGALSLGFGVLGIMALCARNLAERRRYMPAARCFVGGVLWAVSLPQIWWVGEVWIFTGFLTLAFEHPRLEDWCGIFKRSR